ncbi:unnamed protein product [Phytomonas sp. Hart1]|nr:unnamed protein product [Phytomonas sp. Hart1]|eukprot:CCW67635.1 unnamed protein product [Phytomonas sp. isolate Hart1]
MDKQTSRVGSDTDINFLAHYNEHVFIFSSAGKPIFTRYGDESSLSALFGLLQVLVQARRCSSSSSIETPASDLIRRITFANSRFWMGSQRDPQSRDLYLYFSIREELTYVLSTHNDSFSFCSGILEYVHLFMLSVAPKVNVRLRANPSYDARRLYATADFAILRDLINNLQSSFSFHLGAVPSVNVFYRSASDADALRAVRPFFSDLQKEVEKERMTNPSFILSLFLLRGRLLFSCVADNSPAREITPQDVLLLMHFALSIRYRQQGGEIWVPFCLPGFNPQNYVWCYSGCPLDTQRNATPSPMEISSNNPPLPDDPPTRLDWMKDILFIQISVSENDFTRLSNRASCITQILLGGAHQKVPRSASSLAVYRHSTPPCLKRFFLISLHSGAQTPAKVRSTSGKGLSELSLSHLFLLNQYPTTCDLDSSADDLRVILRVREEWGFLDKDFKVENYPNVISLPSHEPHQPDLFVACTEKRSVVLLSHPSVSLLSQLCQYRVHPAVASLRGREGEPQNRSCPISELLSSFHFSNFVSGVENEVKEVVVVFLPHTSVELMIYWTVRLLNRWVTETGKPRTIG